MTELRMPHAEAELLLPWYANRTLDPRERDAVDDHLEQCKECREALELLARVKATVTESDTVPLIPDPRPDRLFEQLDRQTSRPHIQHFTRKWAIAAGIVVAVISTALVYTRQSADPIQPAYRTATSASAGDTVSYVVELRFADAVPEAEHPGILRELGATMIAPVEANTVRVVVPIPARSMSAAERWRSELVARAEIAAAQIVAVQLPVLEDE